MGKSRYSSSDLGISPSDRQTTAIRLRVLWRIRATAPPDFPNSLPIAKFDTTWIHMFIPVFVLKPYVTFILDPDLMLATNHSQLTWAFCIIAFISILGQSVCGQTGVTCNGTMLCVETLTGTSVTCQSSCKQEFCYNNGTCAQADVFATPTCTWVKLRNFSCYRCLRLATDYLNNYT